MHVYQCPQKAAGRRLLGVKDLKVFRGATISDGVEPTLTVSVMSRSTDSQGNERLVLELRDVSRNILHARATVLLGDSLPASPELREVNGLASGRYAHSPKEIYESLLFHGRDFHAVESVDGISEKGLVAELRVGDKPSAWEKEPLRSEWATEPLVVDGVLQLGILWCWDKLGKPSLPNGFESYSQFVRKYPKGSVKAALRGVEIAMNVIMMLNMCTPEPLIHSMKNIMGSCFPVDMASAQDIFVIICFCLLRLEVLDALASMRSTDSSF